MRTLVFVGLFLACSCIKEKGKVIQPVVNPDYQPYCPPLDPLPQQAVVSEWVKKYQRSFSIEQDDEEDTCTIDEEETER